MKTQAALTLLRHITVLDLKPLDQLDRYSFADAADDALIAVGGPALATALVDTDLVETAVTEGEDCVTVIVSGDVVEAHGLTADGGTFAVSLTLGRLL